jgi:hypothetical protein
MTKLGTFARNPWRTRVTRMTARPENVHQTRLLRLLRDGGARSRAEFGDVVHLSRSKLAVELGRLVELGLVEPAGFAASRGGRRSNIVRLSRHLRVIGSTSAPRRSTSRSPTAGWRFSATSPWSAMCARPRSRRLPQTVEAATVMPSAASHRGSGDIPTRHSLGPGVGPGRGSNRIVGGRPRRLGTQVAAWRRLSRSRCQRRIVSGRIRSAR